METFQIRFKPSKSDKGKKNTFFLAVSLAGPKLNHPTTLNLRFIFVVGFCKLRCGKDSGPHLTARQHSN